MTRLITFIVLLLPMVLGAPSKYKDCGSTKGRLIGIDVEPCETSPCKLYRGEDAQLKVKFHVDEEVADGKVKVYGVFAGIPVPFPLDDDKVCHMVKPSCPLIPSVSEYTYLLKLPIREIYPPVKVNVKWTMEDKSSNLVLCALMPLEIGDR
ncbi:unnamed protein product [Calicophoron daubneyi]|uniref:MD-2-related lipid-recognition domain-containing protein n=1 Tax=Calicophoron daubneyi TaxID=300641 RepID=A0AAV2TNB8_CALDB